MSIVVEPILHVIKDPKDWPNHVSTISHQFFRPLPTHLASNAQERVEFFSPGCQELYEEALSSPLLVLRDEDTISGSTIAVADIMDSILSAVMMVKVASSVDARRGYKQAQLSWISVLTQLGIGISEDVIVLEDAMFLRARTKERSVVTDVEDVVGRSLLLLTTLLNLPINKSDTNDARMKTDDTEHETCSCNYSTGSEESVDCLDIPFDAHILPGCGKRVNCVLPLVCVGLEEEIEALVTSVVCQRYVLDISFPVVGISLSASGTAAKIILGWAEGKEDDRDSMPDVHIAYALGTNIHPSVGVFDILNPTSMIYFAQFILWLYPQFLTIRECRDVRVRRICWRLDHLRCPDSSMNRGRWISDWVQGQCADNSEAVESTTWNMAPRNSGSGRQSKPSSSNQFLQVPDPQSSRGSSRSRSRSRSHSSQRDTGSGGSSDSSSSATGLTASYYPASSFAKLGRKTGAKEKWLWERRTIRAFRIELFQPDSDLKRQVCGMIERYNKMVECTWPASWDRLSHMPSRDAVHEGIRHQLFESYREYKRDHSGFPAMETDVFQSIQNHVSALYRAIANAKASQRQAMVKEAKEAALRSSWDELLKAVCCNVDDASSTEVIVETSIPLPRNKATELGSAFEANSQVLVSQGISSYQLSYASRQDRTVNVPDAIRVALAVSSLHALTSRPTTIIQPEDRKYEPATAIVDAICYLTYKIPKETKEAPAGSKSRRMEENPKTKQKETMGWMSKFIKMVSPTFGLNKPCKGRNPKTLPQSHRKDPGAHHATCYMCPFVTETLGLPSSGSSGSSLVQHTELHIPYLYAEYKRDVTSDRQAFHQAQMYVTFGVEYLAALGVKDEAVWALVTSGTTGSIIMAWKSTKENSATKEKTNSNTTIEYNLIIDQYVRTFDISQPLEALQLMACLRRIYQRGLGLQARLKQIDRSVFTNPTSAILDRMMAPRSETKDKKPGERGRQRLAG